MRIGFLVGLLLALALATADVSAQEADPMATPVLSSVEEEAEGGELSPPQPFLTPAPFETPTIAGERIKGPPWVPPSPRYEPLALQPDQALEDQIREHLGPEIAGYGVVVKHLADGRGVAINPDQEFNAASLFKILVMYEVFKQRTLGLLSFADVLTVTTPYLDYQIGELRWPLGTAVSVQDLLEAMITESDNVAAILLHDGTGGWNIRQDIKAIGLTHTEIARERLPTSAGDMAMVLEMLARGKAVDSLADQEMVDLLSRQTINDRLPARLPENARVAHKTANWEDATHDVGVIYGSKGAYVVAVLSDRAWESQPIADIARLVFDHFEEVDGPVRPLEHSSVR